MSRYLTDVISANAIVPGELLTSPVFDGNLIHNNKLLNVLIFLPSFLEKRLTLIKVLGIM